MPSSRAAAPEKGSLLEAMWRHSAHLWIAHHDRKRVTHLSMTAKESSREDVVGGILIPTRTITSEGFYEHRYTRAEAEVLADDELARRAAMTLGLRVQGCALPPRPLGEFTPRRRQVLSVSDIMAMFGEVAA